MYGTVTPEGMNPFLVVDTAYVYIPQGAKVTTLTAIEVPQYAPLVHYEFTGYVGQAQTTYDSDKFGFSVSDTLGMMKGNGPELASSGEDWKLLSGWFGTDNREGEVPQSPESIDLPRSCSLSQNYPNPFNPTTEILYTIPEKDREGVEVSIFLYNIRGQLIKRFDEGKKLPGRYRIMWDGKDDSGVKVGSGVYFYQMHAGDFITTRKMIMAK